MLRVTHILSKLRAKRPWPNDSIFTLSTLLTVLVNHTILQCWMNYKKSNLQGIDHWSLPMSIGIVMAGQIQWKPNCKQIRSPSSPQYCQLTTGIVSSQWSPTRHVQNSGCLGWKRTFLNSGFGKCLKLNWFHFNSYNGRFRSVGQTKLIT